MMRRFPAGALAALCLAAAVASAQAPASKASKASKEEPSWWDGLFGGKPKAEPKKPTGDGTKSVADKNSEHDKVWRAYFRRLAVCNRLREVALETNNESLEDEANRLEAMAWRLYSEQSSKLLGVAAVGMDAEPEAGADRPGASAAGKAQGGALPPRLRSGGAMGARGGPAASRGREEER